MKAFLLALLGVLVALQACAATRPIQRFAEYGPASGVYENSQGSPLIPLIKAATHTIDIEIYTMDDPGFRQALREAMARKVRVRIIKDGSPFGKEECDIFAPPRSDDTPGCTDLKKLPAEIRAAGGIAVPFNKPALCGKPYAPNGPVDPTRVECFQHGKLVVVDGAIALVSTGNFDPSNLCSMNDPAERCNRDYTVITRNPDVLGALVTIFEKDLAGKTYDLAAVLTPGVRAKLTVSPLSLEPLINFINSATQTIVVENQYLKEKNINAALVNKARSGVKVAVMVSSLCYFAHPNDRDRQDAEKTFGDFDAAGISSRLFTEEMRIKGHPGYMHAKAIVVDGTRAWVGSVNGSFSAVAKNREFGLFLSDQNSVGNLMRWMADDFKHPAAESWRESLSCKNDHPAE